VDGLDSSLVSRLASYSIAKLCKIWGFRGTERGYELLAVAFLLRLLVRIEFSRPQPYCFSLCADIFGNEIPFIRL